MWRFILFFIIWMWRFIFFISNSNICLYINWNVLIEIVSSLVYKKYIIIWKVVYDKNIIPLVLKWVSFKGFLLTKMIYINTDKQSLQHKVYQRDHEELQSQNLNPDINQSMPKHTRGLDHHIWVQKTKRIFWPWSHHEE